MAGPAGAVNVGDGPVELVESSVVSSGVEDVGSAKDGRYPKFAKVSLSTIIKPETTANNSNTDQYVSFPVFWITILTVMNMLLAYVMIEYRCFHSKIHMIAKYH